MQKLTNAQLGLGNNLNGSFFQCAQSEFRTLGRKTRTNHHRKRRLRHDLAQERESIHARHLQIGDYHIWVFLLHFHGSD